MWITGAAALAVVAALSQAVDDSSDVITAGSRGPAETTMPSSASSPSTSSTTVTQGSSEIPAPSNEEPAASAAAALAELRIVGDLVAESDYDRDEYQPGRWADTDGDCRNNRHEVLAEESLIPVTYSADGCYVETGRWLDPYTGDVHTSADEVTIDHFVPLAHAHRAGAWAWDLETKQRFTNDLDDPAALAVVGADINQAKADDAPDEWRPPRREAWCLYASDWIRVKTRWSLPVTRVEADALTEMLATCSEPASDPIPTDRLTAPSTALISVSTTTTTTSTTRPSTTTLPSATQAPTRSCDPNYEGACVPIASDVDCAGGSGNGPEYVRGPVNVVGRDIYGLDGDGDGIGCE